MAKLDYHFLSRVVSGLDFHQLRVVGMEAMRCLLGELVVITDGWNDGGSDLSPYRQSNNGSAVAIQLSVQREWRSKLDGDVKKAKEKLGATAFYFVSTRQVDNTFRIAKENELRDAFNMRVSLIGRDQLASILIENDAENVVWVAIGVPAQMAEAKRLTVRDKVLYSYVALSDDVRNFKEKVVDRTLVAVLAANERPQQREHVIAHAVALLGGSDERALLIDTRFSSLQSRGYIVGNGATGFELSGTAKDEWRAMENTLAAENRLLYSMVQQTLTEYATTAIAVTAVEEVSHLATNALLQQQLVDAQQVSKTLLIGELLRVVGNPFEELLIALSGMPVNKKSLDECARALVETISQNSVARSLTCSALYFCLHGISEPAATRILNEGIPGQLDVYLDTSAVLPALCEWLFGSSRNLYSAFSANALRRLQDTRARLLLPQWYLEEAAAHLIGAHRYGELAGEESDLQFSRNAFVAHYAGLGVASGRSFKEYLDEFAAIDVTRIETDFMSVRTQAERGLRELLGQYHISVEHVQEARPEARHAMETALTWVLQNRKERKSATLLRHDVQVLCSLQKQNTAHPGRSAFLTWDKALIQLAKEDATIGWVLNPSVASDLFEVANPLQGKAVSQLSLELTRRLGSVREESARIVDYLLRNARTEKIDADFRRDVRQFKNEFLSRNAPDGLSPHEYHVKFEEEARAFLDSMDAKDTKGGLAIEGESS